MIANCYLKMVAKTIDSIKNIEEFNKGRDSIETLFKTLSNILFSKKKKYTINIATDYNDTYCTYAIESSLENKEGKQVDDLKSTIFVDNGLAMFQTPVELLETDKRLLFFLDLIAYAKILAKKDGTDELKTFNSILDKLVDTGRKTGYTPTNFEIATFKNISKLTPLGVVDNGVVTLDATLVNLNIINKVNSASAKLANDYEKKDWRVLTEENHIYNEFEEERMRNNRLKDGYVPTVEDKMLVQRLYNSVKCRGYAPSFFFYGPAGTGKSEKGKYFSKMTGIPYTFICCSAMTTESDLRGKPQTLGTTGGLVKFFQKVAKSFWNKNIDIDGLDDDKIKYSLTELVLACKYGWIIEIQEPTLIVNAGTLGFLNCILDDNRTLILPDGTQIKIHPNTTFIFTTNLTYEGCNLLNNSLLSRIDYVKKIDLPSISEQVNRLISVTQYKGNRKDCEKVIQAINEISNVLEENQISQGIADFRSAVDCVLDYMENDNTSWRLSAHYTIEDKACLEEGYAETIKNKLDSIFGEN